MAINPIGYFKLHRELFGKPIWENSTIEQKVILITLLAMANFADKQWEWQGKQFIASPGQFVTSLSNIVKNTGQGITVQNVRTALDRFEKLEFISNEATKTGRLITIRNWDVYQSDDTLTYRNPEKQQKYKKSTKKLTKIQNDENVQFQEVQPDSADELTKVLTKTSQRPNKDLTPREEGKEGKKVKNKNISEIIENYTDHAGLKIAINDFVDMRRVIKSELTDNALKLLLRNLDKMTMDVPSKILILEQSTMNSWKGLFELKQQSTPGKPEQKQNRFNNFEFNQQKHSKEEIERKLGLRK